MFERGAPSDDPAILDLLTSAEDFARAAVPAEITCFMLAMGEHAGSQAAPIFAVSSLKLQPDSSGRKWRRLVPRSSLPFPTGLVDSVGHAVRVVTDGTLKPPSCPLTASARTTMCTVAP